MEKYYLIYYYHDTFDYEFDKVEDLIKFLEQLKKEYKNDRDFHYKIIVGKEVKENEIY